MRKIIENMVYNNEMFGGSLLSDKEILEYNQSDLLIQGELRKSQIQPNSIDLTLANTWKKPIPNMPGIINDDYCSRFVKDGHDGKLMKKLIPKDHASRYDKVIINPKLPIEYEQGTFSEEKGIYLIKPGEFVLMASNEVLNIPRSIVGFVCGRSSVARMGIQIEQAGLIDAGFKGTVTFEVFNQARYPIALFAGMRFAQIYFLKADKSDRLYGSDINSKYNGQIDATESRIYLDEEFNKK